MRGWRPLTILLTVLAVAAGGGALTACGDDPEQDAGGAASGGQGPGTDGGNSDSKAGDGTEGGSAPDGGAGGGGGNAGGDNDAGEEAPDEPYRPDPATPEGQANTTVTDVYGALGSGGKLDAGGLCELMTPRAQRQTTRYAEVSSGIAKDWNCELAVKQLVDRSKRTGGFKRVRNVEVLGINVAGDRATATIRFGDGPATSLPLSRHDGEWKLDSSPSGGG